MQGIDNRIDHTPSIFVRDRFTWTAYLLLGYFAYLQGVQGPLMPFLRAELGLSYVVGSLHISAAAAGMLLIGLFGDRVVQALGMRNALWGGAIGISLGALGLIAGSHVAITLLATASMGTIGSLLLVAQQTALAYHHRQNSAVAFSESNIAASLCALLAPLAIGAMVSAGLGWRLAVLLPMPLFAILLVREWRQAVPAPDKQLEHVEKRQLPGRFWAFWVVACLGVAAEWSIGFWGTDYLHTIVGFQLERAVSLLTVFFVAMLAGRIIGSRMVRMFLPAQILGAALVIALVGVVLVWQATLPALNLIGLGLAGLGIGNLFPMSLAAAVASAPGQLAAATARMTLAGGVAIVSAPLILGGWADQVGLRSAFGLVPMMLCIAMLVYIIIQGIAGKWYRY